MLGGYCGEEKGARAIPDKKANIELVGQKTINGINIY
jgi:hypothetical protein